jgi:uncharacterized protein YndB with AHSA1/START domain
LASTRTVIGSLRLADGKAVVRMEDRFDTDARDLWSALTDPGRLARWIARVEGDLRVGGEIHAVFTSGWEGPGRIEICEPPSRLLIRLSPGEEDETEIEARVFPEGATTRLVVEERGLPLSEAAAHGGGWQAHIEDLAAHLAGRAAGDWRARWRDVTPAYEDQQAHLLAEARDPTRGESN